MPGSHSRQADQRQHAIAMPRQPGQRPGRRRRAGPGAGWSREPGSSGRSAVCHPPCFRRSRGLYKARQTGVKRQDQEHVMPSCPYLGGRAGQGRSRQCRPPGPGDRGRAEGASRHEIIFVDDGSTDGTAEALTALKARDPAAAGAAPSPQSGPEPGHPQRRAGGQGRHHRHPGRRRPERSRRHSQAAGGAARRCRGWHGVGRAGQAPGHRQPPAGLAAGQRLSQLAAEGRRQPTPAAA